MSTRYLRHTAHLLTALQVVLTLTACDNFFDRTGDDSSIAADRFFSDDAAFRAAMTDCYIQLRSPHLYGGSLTLTLLEPAAGTLEPYDVDTKKVAAYRQDIARCPELQPRLDSIKLRAHRVIATCNQVIEAATADRLKNAEIRMAVGEAYGLRAALRFDLYRLFGEASDYSELPAIEADLRRASQLLQGVDPLMTESQTSVTVGRQDRRLRTHCLNWYAVKAIQARVALWQRSYDEALLQADSALLHQQQVTQRNQVFYFVQPGKFGSDFCFSREFIFAIATRPDGFPALSDSLFLRLGVSCPSLQTKYTDVSDIRYRTWFRSTADGQGYTMQRKFGSQTLLTGYVVSSLGSEMQLPASIPFIKMGEVVLTAAEALLQTGRVEEALQRVEQLEQLRDCPSYAERVRAADGVTADAVGRLIAEEYERELYGEGQLYYYHKRSRP